jgi:acyl-CoA reductase-like NAD-dependent aldehyde dehydrogenase
MKDKKTQKYIENAELKFQKEQLQAATAAEQLSKSIAVVEQYKEELTDLQYQDVMKKFEEQRNELERFLINARDRYAKKLKELGDPTLDFGLEDEDLL